MAPLRLLAILLIGIACSGLSEARDSVVGMSEGVFKLLGEAQTFMDSEDYDAARQLVQEGLERGRLSSYERAHLLNVIGYTWYEQEELDRAVTSYREALDLEDLPNSMLVTLNLTLGQIGLVMENYEDAERHLRRVLTFEGQDLGPNKVLLASALVGQGRYADSLAPLLEAIEAEEKDGGIPRENWLALLSSVYYELEDYPRMRDVMEKLVIAYPREQYVTNLAALHGQLGDTEKQLTLIETLRDDSRLNQPAQLLMLVNLLLGAEMPYQAATLLSQELDRGRIESTVRNLELLSQAWYLASETQRAIEPLTAAAKLSENGDIYLRLARMHMDAYQWREAANAAQAALEKGGLRKEGEAWLLRGMAEVRMQQFVEARRQFQRARKFDDTQKYADQWLQYVSAEEQRSAAVGG
jgi:tetratricopeptide (TPR) repeat protein